MKIAPTMRMSIKASVAKTKKGYTSLRYEKPDGMPHYFYVESLDAKPGDVVTIIIEQEELTEDL